MTKTWLVVLGLVAGLIPLSSVPAQAATLEVCPSGCVYATIQQALAAADSGDTISVAPGIYPGGFTISKNVTVQGSGAGRTTVRGTGRAGVSITVASGVTAAIEDITVDAVPPPAGSADGVDNNGTLTVQDTTVTGSNGNAAILTTGTLTLERSSVRGNNTTGIRNVANPPAARVTIDRSTITGNAGFDGIENSDWMTIDHSTITGNAGDTAGGVNNTGTLTIRASTIGGNIGGGIANGVIGSNISMLTLDGVTIKDNFSGPVGGFWNGTHGVAILRHTRVIRNTAATYGGIYNQGTLTLDDSIVRHNIPNNCVGC